MVHFEIEIQGKVQGVGYRHFATVKASELGIEGWVKNSSNGSVIVRAQGDKQAVQTFIDYLRRGPSSARVDDLSASELNGTGEYSGFNVKY